MYNSQSEKWKKEKEKFVAKKVRKNKYPKNGISLFYAINEPN